MIFSRRYSVCRFIIFKVDFYKPIIFQSSRAPNCDKEFYFNFCRKGLKRTVCFFVGLGDFPSIGPGNIRRVFFSYNGRGFSKLFFHLRPRFMDGSWNNQSSRESKTVSFDYSGFEDGYLPDYHCPCFFYISGDVFAWTYFKPAGHIIDFTCL